MRFLIAASLVTLIAACSPTPGSAPKTSDTATSMAAPPAPVAAKPTVTDGWVASTATGVRVSAGYMTVANPGGDDTLVSAVTPAAGKTELHVMEHEAATGAMKMRMAEGGVPVPAAGEVRFAPGGTHLMFFDLAAPLVEGASIPVTLTFAKAGVVETTLTVKSRAAMAAKPDAGKH